MRAPSLDLDARETAREAATQNEEAQTPLARATTPAAPLVSEPESGTTRPKLSLVARNSTSELKKASWPFKGQEIDGPETSNDRPEKEAKKSRESKKLEVKSMSLAKSEPKVPAHARGVSDGRELRSELNRATNQSLKRELGEPFNFAGPQEQTADHPPEAPPERSLPRVEARKKAETPRGSSALFVWADGAMRPSVSNPPSAQPPPPPPDSSPKADLAAAKKPRTPTGVVVPGVPLPPATEHGDRPKIRLRRNESVIADAVAEKNGSFWKAERIARRASTQMAGIFSGGLAAASLLGEFSARGVRKFESMPRKKQIMWVAAPYGVVIMLVLVLIELRQPVANAAATVIPPVPMERAAQQVQMKVPVETPAVPEDAVAKLVGKEIAPSPAPVEQPAPAPEPVVEKERPAKTVWKTLPINASLRAKADVKAPKIAKLKANSKLITYPDFPAREGWVLAQRPDGEIGFIKESIFEATPQPAVKATRGRARPAKADPFRELQRPRRRPRF